MEKYCQRERERERCDILAEESKEERGKEKGNEKKKWGGDEWPAKQKNIIYVYKTEERRKVFFFFGNYFCNKEDEIKMETLTFIYMVWEFNH